MTTITVLPVDPIAPVVISPNIVNGYQSTSTAQHIFHAVIGRAFPDVTLRPATLRSGTLTMIFASEADAADAENRHRQAGLFALSDDDLATIAMQYVAAGSISRRLEDESQDAWVVSVDFQEVSQ